HGGGDAALALARGAVLGRSTVYASAAGIEDRDLARDADEIGGAKRAARPGAAELHRRHGIALAPRELDARLGGRGLVACGAKRRVRREIGRRLAELGAQLRERAAGTRAPAARVDQRGERGRLLVYVGGGTLHAEVRERGFG